MFFFNLDIIENKKEEENNSTKDSVRSKSPIAISDKTNKAHAEI